MLALMMGGRGRKVERVGWVYRHILLYLAEVQCLSHVVVDAPQIYIPFPPLVITSKTDHE